ncbi:MAG: MotA/TolQ/ExbB proton channel family protein [Bacteroides sp.]|nr:MotA/TolQ/ExbB proton channel family protein [Bacteroides sp.]
MTALSEILFIISNGLMIPVILSLLYFLARAVGLLFSYYKKYVQKRQIADIIKALIKDYSPEELNRVLTKLVAYSDSCVVRCLSDLVHHSNDRIYCEHALLEFQVDVQKQLSKHRLLIKFGPMLGLMGTLIPMGPALVGLASGDIASMASNMQVAFATTVVGMAVAAIGLATLQGNKRFYARSLSDLDFVFQKLNEA